MYSSTRVSVGLTWVHYEVAVIGIIAPAVIFYLYLMKQYFAGKKNTVIGHLTFVLLILWIEYMVKIIPRAWKTTEISGFLLPPIQVIFDIIIAGYIIGILWNLWWGEKDVTLT